MSSGFEQLARLLEQPDARAIIQQITVESCQRILTGYLASDQHELGQVLAMLDRVLIKQSPILALFVSHSVIEKLRQSRQMLCRLQ
jgi:hypothetical protein